MNWEETKAYLSACFPREAAEGFERVKPGELRDIRVRTGRPALMATREGAFPLGWTPGERQVEQLAEALSEHALYARGEETRKGFITLRGGHRMGLCGRVICQGRAVRALREIASLCIRIAGEWPGAADEAVKYLWDGSRLRSILVIGLPGTGKTTLLRDLCRQASEKGTAVCLVDERGELAACQEGAPQLDVGPSTDVLDGCPKAIGMEWLMRAMAPQLLVSDELGGMEDAQAVIEAVYSGVPVAASVHGASFGEVMKRPSLALLQREKVFDCYLVLDGGHTGRIQAVYGPEGGLWR